MSVLIDGINYELYETDHTAEVCQWSDGKFSGDVTIPSTIVYKGIVYSVTSIGDYAFEDCTGLTSITIPNSVTSIGWNAFSNVPNIVYNGTATGSPWGARSVNGYVDGYLVYADATKATLLACSSAATGAIVIPNSVTSIGDGAFILCRGLTSVTIPNSVTSIGWYAFSGCTGLTAITIPNSVTSIGEDAFYNVPNIVYNGTATGSPWGAKSVNGYVDGYWVYADATKTTLLACSSAATGAIVIPNSVTSIGRNAFYDCTGLTAITIPNSVTSIGSSAFSYCTGLTSITIPNSVTSIEDNAFSYVPNIVYNGTATGSPWEAKSVNGYVDGYLVYADATKATLLACSSAATGAITIPNSVTNIGDDAFWGCTGLTYVTIPESVTSIGSSVFSGCAGLTSVTIPNSVTSIGDKAFLGCTGLTAITIPNSVTSIGSDAFRNCTGLTSITIPNSVTSIGDDAFWGCTSLTAITIPENVTSIDGAFRNCTGLTAVTIPNSVTSIGKEVFYGCTGLTSVTIPESVTSIEESAFHGCTGLTSVVWNAKKCGGWSSYNSPFYSARNNITSFTFGNEVESIPARLCYDMANLTSITIPESVTSIGDRAFWGCTGLTAVTIPESVTSIGDKAFSGCKGLTSVTIPNSVTSIGESAFYDCRGLTSVSIPNSVTSIGDDAFSGCKGLTSITIPYSVASVGDDAFSGCTGLTAVTIPESVTNIGEYAFSGCTGLTAVTIPNSVTNIGDYAFRKCTGLTSVTIPNSVTNIGNSAFAGCTGLTSVTIPNSVTNIGSSAFSGCTGLTSITIPNSVTSIEWHAFSGCTGLTSITIPNSVTSIGYCAFAGCTGLTSITIPNSVTSIDSVTSIGDRVFEDCTGLTSVTIGNSVTSIGKYAFENCTGLTSITIPNSVTSIGESAFYDCRGLTSVSIPNSVTSIGNYAFCGCTGLTSITIPNSVTSIESGTFYKCTGLTAITIPNSVTSIGYKVFEDCTSLTSIAIPNSVTSIESGTFYKCTGLTSITIPESVTSIGNYAFQNCIGLTSITIPNSVTSIGDDAFSWCTGLTSITIPNSVTRIGDGAFMGCTGLTSVTIPNSVTSIGGSAFFNIPNIVYNGTATGSPWGARSVNGYVDGYLVYADATKTTLLACYTTATGAIAIPNSVTSIGEYAFGNCTGLTSITIPNFVTSIGERAFYDCTGLTSVAIPESVTSIGWNAFDNVPNIVYNGTAIGSPWGARSVNGYVDGYLVYADATKTTLLACSSAATGAIVIPNSVTSIGESAFWFCTGLTAITIPNSVTNIGDYAFFGCAGLTSIIIPNSVTSIGWDAFSDVPNIVYNGTATGSPWEAKSVNGYVDGYLVYADATKTTLLACSSAATGAITIPESVTSIGSYAFSGCTGLTSITIPNSVTSIGSDAFRICTGLPSITIPNSVTNIGEEVFGYCEQLCTIRIPHGRKSIFVEKDLYKVQDKIIEYAEFYDGDIQYELDDNMTSTVCAKAGKYAGDIVIPTRVEHDGNTYTTKRIAYDAFRECYDLTSITLPKTITEIGEDAFEDCENLQTIRVPKGMTDTFCRMGLEPWRDKIVEPQQEEYTILLNIARGYELGIGMARNLAQAVLCYAQAADKGCAEAAYHLGELYEEGKGLPQDYQQAADWFAKASQLYHPNGETRRKACLQHIEEENARLAAFQEEQNVVRQVPQPATTRTPQKTILFFDTETNGLPQNYKLGVSATSNWPRMIQLGWIITDEAGNILKRKSQLIYPQSFTIAAEVTRLTGITTAAAQRNGVALTDILPEFMADVEAASLLVGHNIDFDCHIVGCELYRNSMDYSALMDKPSVCTMVRSTDFCALPSTSRYYSGYKFPTLTELYTKLFGHAFSGAHDALSDITATKDCYFELLRRGII